MSPVPYHWEYKPNRTTKENEMTDTALAPDPISLSEALDIPPLTLMDYCDSDCGQVAYVRIEIKAEDLLAVTPGQYLDLCAHHYHVNEVELAVQGYRVLDERARLIAAEKAFRGQV
jgi:hypothetical protein